MARAVAVPWPILMLTRLFTVLVVCVSLRLVAATGDFVSAAVQTNGWTLELTFVGGTGGTYDLGLGTTNRLSGAEKVALAVTSEGYSSAGVLGTVSRTVYGTKQVRRPYPNQTQNEETVNGANVTVRIALSDFIHADDTNIRLTLGSGLYTYSGTPSSAASNVSVSNQSTQPYVKAVGKWSWPNYQIVTNSLEVPLRATLYHRSGIAAVKWTLTDGTATNIYWSTKPTIEASLNDSVPVVEFVEFAWAQNLTNAYSVTANFTVYPTVGDAASVLRTDDGAYSEPTPLHAPRTFLFDPFGLYGYSWAVVNASTGNDSTGIVTTNRTQSPNHYATINGALAAIAATNNLVFGRNNVAGGVVYLTDDAAHASFGGSSSYGSAPDFWVEITNVSGDSPTINAASGRTSLGTSADKLKLSGITFTGTATLYDENEHLWVDGCTVNTSGTFSFDRNTVSYWTRNLMQSVNNYGIGPAQATRLGAPALIRANTFSNFTGAAMVYAAIGNKRVGSVSAYPQWRNQRDAAQTVPVSDNFVFAGNYMPGMSTAGNTVAQFAESQPIAHGAAIVQNVLEGAENGASPIFWVAADSSTGAATNVLLWHNVFNGQRSSIAYNDSGSSPVWRMLWSSRYNVLSVSASKTDTFTVADGNRIGNWSMIYRVGAYGDWHLQSTNMTAAGQFLLEFPGINSYQPPPGGWLSPTNFAAWYDDNSAFGTTTAGFGVYKTTAASPWLASGFVVGASVLPYDIEGHLRTGYDAPGAYGYHPESSTEFVSVLHGSDSAAGSWVAPYRTVAKLKTTITSGETGKVAAGNYQEDVTFDVDGSAGARLIFDGQGVARMKTIRPNGSFTTFHAWQLGGHATSFSGMMSPAASSQDGLVISNNWFHQPSLVANISGIHMDLSSPPFTVTTPINSVIISNLFTGFHGYFVWQVGGSNNLYTGNTMRNNSDVDWVRLFGKSNVITGNIFTNNYDHPSGGNHKDWLQSFGQTGHVSTGHLVSHNLVHGGLWPTNATGYYMGQSPGSDPWSQVALCQLDEPNDIVKGWTVRSNVMANLAYGSLGIPDTTWENNTFYRVAIVGSSALQLGGDGGGYASNTVVRNNAFVACGNTPWTTDAPQTSKGWYGIDATASDATNNSTFAGNFVTGFTGWAPKDQGNAFANWVWWTNVESAALNGGDPRFLNAANPLGDDGVWQTVDDGFSLAAASPLLLSGIGGANIGAYAGVGPLIWYTFEDDFESGPWPRRITDQSGYGAHALEYGNGSNGTNWPSRITASVQGTYAGRWGRYLGDGYFVNTNYHSGQYAAITNIPTSLQGVATELTVAAWARADELEPGWTYVTANEQYTTILNGGWNRLGAWHFGRYESVAGGALRFQVSTNTVSGGDAIRAVFPYPDGYTDTNWYHYAATAKIQGSDVVINLYTNGLIYSATTNAGYGVSAFDVGATPRWLGLSAITHNQSNPALGPSKQPNIGWWHGDMDDVRVYDRVLSGAEIAALAGAEYEPPAPPPPASGSRARASSVRVGSIIVQ